MLDYRTFYTRLRPQTQENLVFMFGSWLAFGVMIPFGVVYARALYSLDDNFLLNSAALQFVVLLGSVFGIGVIGNLYLDSKDGKEEE
jgi:hypothetical protein